MFSDDHRPELTDYDIYSKNLNPSSRKAYLHVPGVYDGKKALPLLIALHGKVQPPQEFANHTRFPSFGFEGFIVFPQGIKLQWTGDPESPPRSEVDDIAFINILIDRLQEDYVVDASRIYASGFSNGGGLTALLACDPTASGRIAAFAVSSGAFYTDSALKEPLFSQCHPSRSPISVLEFHGDSDPVIHYDGKTTPDGVTYEIMGWMADWAKHNGCHIHPDRTVLHDGNVERLSWTLGDDEVVVHYYIHGFGHGWPTTFALNNDEQRHGPTYMNGTPIVLEYFGRFCLS